MKWTTLALVHYSKREKAPHVADEQETKCNKELILIFSVILLD